MQNTTIIYHHGCADGLAGLWCFHELIQEDPSNKIFEGKFNTTIPIEEVKDRHLIFVDFTYRAEITEILLQHAASITVLDHHKTAMDLQQFVGNPKFILVLDMMRSGAQIAWDFTRTHFDKYINMKQIADNNSSAMYMPVRPWFIEDVADRDLWTWRISESKASTKAMNALGFYKDIETFNELTKKERHELISIGNVLIKIDNDTISKICERAIKCYCTSPLDNTKSWTVMLVPSSHNYASEVGAELVKLHNDIDFAAMYRYDLVSDEWWISLRASSESKTDLTVVAKFFSKGGGHAKAAGITLLGSKGQSLKSVFTPIPKEDPNNVLQQPNTSMGEPSQL